MSDHNALSYRIQIQNNHVDVLELLESLISEKSIVDNNVNIDNCYEIVLSYLKGLTFQHEFSVENELKSLIIDFGKTANSRPSLIFLGHVDVVPCNADWVTDPFKLTKKSDYLFGRGVTDMKGGIACFLKALKMLVIDNDINGKHIRIILTGDEEVGSDRGTKALISKGLVKGSSAICGEPTNLNIYNGSRGLIWGKVEIFGESGHAGFGTDFFNPIEKLAEVINELSKFDLKMTHKEFPNSNSKINITTLYTENTALNTIPYSTTFGFDLRILPGIQTLDLKTRISTFLDRIIQEPFSYKLNIVREWPSYYLDNNNNFLLKCLNQLNQVNPIKTLDVDQASDDSSWLAREGIPTILYGPGDPLEAHSSNEKVLLSDLLEAIEFYLLVLKNI
jgi:acetylornithine deacetylase/succinyl-diaminopimelate desuccinylase family protein